MRTIKRHKSSSRDKRSILRSRVSRNNLNELFSCGGTAAFWSPHWSVTMISVQSTIAGATASRSSVNHLPQHRRHVRVLILKSRQSKWCYQDGAWDAS
eukprot:COSAG01_NODE_41272_length_453_cov_1.759887_1_plen_97_part_01